MKKFLALFLWLSFFYLDAHVYSDEAGIDFSQPTQNDQAYDLSYNYGSSIKEARIELGVAFGDYIGIRHGYTELGFFGMAKTPNDIYPFVEARGFLLSNRDWVTSVGFGFRKPLCTCCPVIIGANIYYDFENAKFSEAVDCNCCDSKSVRRHFQSIGIGFEILSPCVDFRTNAYLPVRAEHNNRTTYSYPGGYVLHFKSTRYIQYGVDAEVGKRFNFCSELYAAVGGYGYFYKDTKSFYGPFARLEYGFGDYLTLQARYSYDKRFHSSVQGRILFSLPLETLFRCFEACCCTCFDPLVQPVQRNYIPFVQKKCCWNANW